jgi:outer membrane receptor protein involved in Fe transport
VRVAVGVSLAVAALLAPFAPAGFAGTTGRISGRVVDAKQEPLIGANVAIPALKLGAVTDAEGRYIIPNIPAGEYEVRFTFLGYRAVTVQAVNVAADQVTRLDQTMAEAPVEMEEIVVSAERPVVDVNLTSNLASVTRKDIQQLPVQDLQDVVNLQAGVVDGHFRGGRIGEVQYQVDGVSVNNPYNNQNSIRIDRSLLQEVQVVSGTFDAEYGQAMSGVVNAVLRRGGDKFEWDFEGYLGTFFYPWNDSRILDDRTRLGELNNFQFSFSGPSPFANTTYLANFRRGHFDDWIYGEQRFLPTDEADFTNGVFTPSGTGEQQALGWSDQLSALFKISNQSLPGIEVGYQILANHEESRRSNWAFRLLPDGLTRQTAISLVQGLDWTHTLSKRSFYQVALRQNYFDYKDLAYEDVYDAAYDSAGGLVSDPNYDEGAYVQGVDFGRFKQTTNTWVLKGSWTSQFNPDHSMKAGGEMQWPEVTFGTPGYLLYTSLGGQQTLTRYVDQPPKFPGPQTYHPVSASAFAQDDIEWNDLRLRAGLRLDLFDANSTVPSDLSNPANAIQGAPPSVPVETTTKASVSPRIGVSYPISAGSALYFAYGHFYQMPALGLVFQNADYSALVDLQAGVSYTVMGNPDISPEKTIQYQFGYKQALTDWLGLDVSMYYKDIRDLLGIEFIDTYNDARYPRYTNVDFGSVIGTTVTLDQRQIGLLGTSVDYTYQLARGNSSDPNETATRAEAGEDPRPRTVPFIWDQRHTLNLSVLLSKPGDFSVSGILRYVSGQPYTPTVSTGFGSGLETNSGRKPNATLVDLRAEKSALVLGLGTTFFARVFNLFDTRYFNGAVFSSTGDPYYSSFPVNDRLALEDPTRFYAPRRFELGFTLRGGR